MPFLNIQAAELVHQFIASSMDIPRLYLSIDKTDVLFAFKI